ncbi:MAG: hypothetical protein GXP25_11870 [Planctomycetes bacterium]|nr:hypothetical protein [Planctomycetota bacterium]
MTMTPRKRVETVLHGDVPDKVPFTIYEAKLPQCTAERQLRDEGICIVNRKFPVFRTRSPHNIRSESHNEIIDGVPHVRRIIHTPAGDLSTLDRPAGFTSWHVEKLFKEPEDYAKLMWTVKDQEVEPYYDAFIQAEKDFGEDAIFRAGIGSNPLHQIMITWMGVETFAIEWAERRDEIDKLYNTMKENLRKVYPIVAQSPAQHANFGGNETADVMGRERFEQYVVPLYNEAADAMHKHGKLVGTHLDGNNKPWADLVADSGLDYIEAFTPAPDTDMSLAEAFDAWPDKIMWINFPSSIHLASDEDVEETTRELIQASAPDKPLLIGITEDIPEYRWRDSLRAISRAIHSDGVYPLK